MPSLRRTLWFLVRINPTVRSAVNLERSCSLSKKIKNLTSLYPFSLLHVWFPFSLSLPFSYECLSFILLFLPFAFLSFPFLISFSYHFFFSFLLSFFSLLFFFHFLFSFGHSLSHFDRLVKRMKLRRKFPSHFLNPIVWLSFFHFYSLFLYLLYDIMLSCGSL